MTTQVRFLVPSDRIVAKVVPGVGQGGCACRCVLLHVLRSTGCRYESGASCGSVTGVSVTRYGVCVIPIYLHVGVWAAHHFGCMSITGCDSAASDLGCMMLHVEALGCTSSLGVTACHVSAACIISHDATERSCCMWGSGLRVVP